MSSGKMDQYIVGDWETHIDGYETAYYVLKHYGDDFAEKWKKAETRKGYGNYLSELILPRLNCKPLQDYTMNDIDCIMAELREVQMTRYANDLRRVKYKPATVEKFVVIIRYIFRYAEKNGICDDLDWGENKKPVQKKAYDERKKEERTRLHKSLSVAVEKAVAKTLLNDPLMTGVRMALLLMFAFGLRNSEALGAVYGNIMKIEDCWFLATHSTPDDAAASITIGGKTYNMYRILPIPDLVLPILWARRDYVEAEIKAGKIKLDPERGIKSVYDFPIANKEDNWMRPCTAAQLTRAGRVFLGEAKIEGDMLLYLVEDMAENHNELVHGKEKDPTAYLLRRNFGEHLRDCGCTPAQAERCMGHVQTDPRIKNNDFSNNDELMELVKILARRPLLNTPAEVPIIDVSNAEDDVVLEDISEAILSFARKNHDTEYIIHLVSNERHVPPEVKLVPVGRDPLTDPYTVEYEAHRYSVTNRQHKGAPADVNVVRDYQNRYRRKNGKKGG